MRTDYFLLTVLITSTILTSSCDHTTDGKQIPGEADNTPAIAAPDPIPVFSGDTALVIQDIQSQVQFIDQIENWDTVIEKSVTSTEGGSARYFYWNDTLQKIHVESFGHTGQYTANYYFRKGALASIYDVHTQYNRPIYWDSTEMELNNDTEVFDASKSRVSIWQSYWYKGMYIDREDIQLPESETTNYPSKEAQRRRFDSYMETLEENTDVQSHNR